MMSTLATIIKVNSPCGCRVVPDDVSEGDEIDVDARSIREDKWTCGVCHKDHFIQVVAVLCAECGAPHATVPLDIVRLKASA